MTAVSAVDRASLTRRAHRLAWLTIGWNTIEGLVAVASGLAAGSVALIGFGLDSSIEVLAGVVVLWHLGGETEEREQQALRIIALTFFALAAYVLAEAARDLLLGYEAETSGVGIALAAVSLAVMPSLALAKRRTGRKLENPVVLADAAETALCSSLSAILLGGLLLNAAVGWWWADPVAAIAIAIIAVREGREAWHGDHCEHRAPRRR